MEISHIIFKQTPKNETLYPRELYFLLHSDKQVCLFLYVYLFMFSITFKEPTTYKERGYSYFMKQKVYKEAVYINRLMRKAR